jgi:hypothetical protein
MHWEIDFHKWYLAKIVSTLRDAMDRVISFRVNGLENFKNLSGKPGKLREFD